MNEIVMYIIANSSIRMSPGKLAAQVAHVAVKAFHAAEKHEIPDVREAAMDWFNGSYAKIVLRANEQTIRDIADKYTLWTYITLDEGRTEIPAGTLTALAFVPMPRDKQPQELKELKLL